MRASGPGLNTTGVPASLPVEFTIDAKDAGEGLLAVQITVSTRNILNCTRGENGWIGLVLIPDCFRIQKGSPRRPTFVITKMGLI